MGRSLETFGTFKRMLANNPSLTVLSGEDLLLVQKTLLSVMDDIHTVCRANDLTYFMSGGNALGAIRHGGFIPWDDDIDLYMPRSSYARFRDCMLRAFPEKYAVHEIHTNTVYDLSFMKVRLKGTVFLEALDEEMEEAGLFVDIFPMENVANGALLRKLQRVLSDGMLFVCSCVRIRKKKAKLLALANGDARAEKAIRLKAAIALPFSFVSLRRWLLWTDRVLSMVKREDTAYVSVPSAPGHFMGELFPRAFFFPPTPLSFEGRNYDFLAQPLPFLEKKYGDYMTLPPEEEREHHVLLKFDLSGQDAR